MECTQRLECTQELYETHTERTCPEQIGFLGICGAKHPVLRGPNKIGRDPQTCNIVLNLNSVSRQHAVINVLNGRDFMLMDLDSANKTKLLNKTLQPYIPHPLKNGDTVQFGDIFGIFRLLEEDDELPMTQAIDIPETPMPSKHVSKLHKAPTTVIPESPDVSDRDDSFTTQSHTISKTSKLSNSQYIKPFGKNILIQPVSSPKTDSNRNSSKRSTSLSFIDNPNTSLNESFFSLNAANNVTENIHEMDTQPPNPIANDSTDSIYTADTQIPPEHVPSPSIHSLDTQVPTTGDLPEVRRKSDNQQIHSLDTQLPTTENLPEVRKINDQQEMQFHIYAANKENDISIFNAETQPFAYDKNDSTDVIKRKKSNSKDKKVSLKRVSKESISEEELLFDEIDGGCVEEDFNSQKILPDESLVKEDGVKLPGESKLIPSKTDTRIQSDDSTDCEDMFPTQIIPELPKQEKDQLLIIKTNNEIKAVKRTARMKSDSSTDCEDIDMMPTQIIPKLPITKHKEKDDVNESILSRRKNTSPVKRLTRIQSDSSTDCEDINIIPTQKIPESKVNEDDDVTDCEDDLIELNKNTKADKPFVSTGVTSFEDMPTQIIDVEHHKRENFAIEDMPTQIIDVDCYGKNKLAFEDMPTQVIDVDAVATDSKNIAFADQPTQIIDIDDQKNRVLAKKTSNETDSPFKIPFKFRRVKSIDIPKIIPKDKTVKSKCTDGEDNYYDATQDIYDDLCSQRESSPEILRIEPKVDQEVRDKFVNNAKRLSPAIHCDEEGVSNFVSNLSSQQVRDVIGVDQIAKEKNVRKDSSDVENTPKKAQHFLFTDSDLPSSQEIKSSMMSSRTKPEITESSSESESENYSEEITPFLHRKKKKKPVAKINLTNKFEIEKLPERVITRQRKPTAALQTSTEVDRKLSASILKPKYLLEQEDQIDQDIISENIKRLKTYEKSKSIRDSKSDESIKDDKKESTSQKITENKTNKSNIKIKVKIEKPKRKDTKARSKSSASKTNENEKCDGKDSLDSKSVASTASRRTRGKKKESENKREMKSVSPEIIKKEPENKRQRANNKREEKSKSPEVEIRRSKRQRKVKEKNDDYSIKVPKSILKKTTHEQSTVYNISSSSGESPRNLKRSMVDDSEVPSPKRTRSLANSTNNSSITNASLRATPARVMKTQHVLLTAFPSEEVKQKLEKLGAVIVTDVLECTMVLTMQVKRTFKLLCAMGLGRPIVGPSWVQACADTHMIVDPWLYLIKDEAAEKRFQFTLERTLNGKRNFLKGYNVSSTPSVQPNASEMKLIVECSGGTWKEGGSNWVCVSSTKDKGLWPSLRKRGATVVSTEFILGGVLRQKVDIASNKFP